MNLDTIRLHSACYEWRLLYTNYRDTDIGGDSPDECRKRMAELTSEITSLENKTGLRSRDIIKF